MGKIVEKSGVEEVRKRWIDEARTSGAKVRFASLMEICHLKNAELEAKHQTWISYPDCQDCAGQAADAVSANTQVKMEDAHKLLKIPKSECPDIWIRLPRHKWPKSWSSMEDPVVPLERNLYGHPLAGLLWERQFEKNLIKTWLGEKSKLRMPIRTPSKKGYSYLCMLDDIKLAGKKQNLDPMWKLLNKEVDLGRTNVIPWIMYTWGCTQRQCE